MKKGWIIYHKQKNQLIDEDYSINRFIDAAKNLDIEIEVYSPQCFELIISKKSNSILINGEERTLPDFVLPRTGSGTTYFTLSIMRQLERLNIFVCNSSRSIEIVKDKLQTHQLLAQSNLPTPKTMLLKFPIDVNLVEQEIGFPLIIKNITGSNGKGVYLCESVEQFIDLIELMQSYNSDMNIILQEFVNESYGKDLRVLVVNDQAVACMQRTAIKGFKANFALGANVKSYNITPEIAKLAVAAAKKLGLKVAGIDLLFCNDGFKVLEANSSPDFQGLEKATNIDVAKNILNYIKDTNNV